MPENKKAELLAPAGSMEALKTALRFGADAVYLGGSFMQLRAGNVGFDDQMLAEAAKVVHKAGKKLYVTVNCFAKNQEIGRLGDYARYLYEIGADAAIISDIGVIDVFKKAEPRLDIHLSTQANCQNYAAARVFHDLGCKRIVLGREATLEDIAEIRAKTPPTLELEAFIHGAMCMAYSGRCLISSFMASRSGNRGECAQPCRWNYALTEEKRPGEYFPIAEEDGYSAILSSHDLNTVDFVEDIVRAGVSSLKIEGRMKTPYYIATVVRAYRMKLDGLASPAVCREELECASHRPYSSGFYFGKEQAEPYNDGLYRQKKKIAAVVTGVGEGYLEIEQRNLFSSGDELELLAPGIPGGSFTVTGMEDTEGNAVERAPHPRQKLKLACPLKAEPGDMLRMKSE
ncbi:MAG: U32 family peptidase [Clostridia bacterium]|nr:U32 family peptidase [Clostridia bacterium]